MRLRQAVINGPKVHPGARFVIDENGNKVRKGGGDGDGDGAVMDTTKTMMTATSIIPTPFPRLTSRSKAYAHARPLLRSCYAHLLGGSSAR